MTVRQEHVREAVERVRTELGPELQSFELVLFPETVEFSYGGWLIRAELRPGSSPRKSYDLHRLIERVEERLHDLTSATVTVDLRPAA